MKFQESLLLILSLFFNCFCSIPAEEMGVNPPKSDGDIRKSELRVMSYNVRHCSPPSSPTVIDVEAIAKIIRDSGADIVGLQEIDVNTSRSGENLDQAAKLAELTGMYFYFSKGIDYQGGAYGTAILSKFPISEQVTIPLPKQEGTEQRTLSLVTATLADGQQIRFANTHLDFTSDANALAQAQVITQTLKDHAEPVLLVGDFNVVQDSNTFRHLNQFFRATCEAGCQPTIPADVPKKTIDFIFYSTSQNMEVRMHEVLDQPVASDHRPVLARLTW